MPVCRRCGAVTSLLHSQWVGALSTPIVVIVTSGAKAPAQRFKVPTTPVTHLGWPNTAMQCSETFEPSINAHMAPAAKESNIVYGGVESVAINMMPINSRLGAYLAGPQNVKFLCANASGALLRRVGVPIRILWATLVERSEESGHTASTAESPDAEMVSLFARFANEKIAAIGAGSGRGRITHVGSSFQLSSTPPAATNSAGAHSCLQYTR